MTCGIIEIEVSLFEKLLNKQSIENRQFTLTNIPKNHGKQNTDVS